MLNVKVWRDIKSRKGMFFAVAFIIFLGVSLYTSFYISYLNLSDTYNYFYERTNFEDIAIEFNFAPAELLKEVKKVDGVKEVAGRVSIKSSIEIEGERITLRLISVPDGEQPEVNKLVVEGEYIPKNEYESALLLKEFADYHGIHAGESIYPEFNGKKFELRITGLVYSPEYVWIIEDELFTSPRSFGVTFIPYKKIEELGFEGKINEVHLTVHDDERSEEILNKVRKIFEPYGIKNFYTREHQPSNEALQIDLEGFRELAVLIPSFILVISIFAVYVLLTRLVSEQTPNIGVLRALGFGKRTILVHYLKHSIFIGLTGSVFGIICGYIASILLTIEYTNAINIPYYVAKPHFEVLLAGLVIGTATPALSGFIIAKKAAELEIVHALKGYLERPAKGFEIDKYIPFFEMSTLMRLSLRNMFRNKKRTAYSAFSVIAAIMLILSSMVFVDSVDEALSLQFNRILNYDLEVKFSSFVNGSALKDVKSVRGVREAYPVISTWMLIERDGKVKSMNLIGIDNQNLYNIYDMEGNRHMPPPEGIVLPKIIANNLSLAEGQKITFFTETGKKNAEIYDIFEQPLTPSAYSSLDYLQKLLGVEGYNTIIVKANPEEEDRIRAEIENYPGVLRVESISETEEEIKSMLEFFYVFIFFSLAFGMSLGYSAIFNTTTINIMERRRELATLRTLGYTTRQLGLSIFVENMVIGFIGAFIGIPLGYFVAYAFLLSFNSELYQMPFVIYGRTYLLTVISVFIILSLSILPGLRYISRMDIEKVTKEIVS